MKHTSNVCFKKNSRCFELKILNLKMDKNRDRLIRYTIDSTQPSWNGRHYYDDVITGEHIFIGLEAIKLSLLKDDAPNVDFRVVGNPDSFTVYTQDVSQKVCEIPLDPDKDSKANYENVLSKLKKLQPSCDSILATIA